MLPEEEEYAAAVGPGTRPGTPALEEEVRTLVALAFGVAILLGLSMVVLLGAYLVTGWPVLLVLNLVIAGLAIVAFMYLMYRRSRLTMGY